LIQSIIGSFSLPNSDFSHNSFAITNAFGERFVFLFVSISGKFPSGGFSDNPKIALVAFLTTSSKFSRL